MIISLIVAMDKKNLIASNNSLPWKIKNEMKLFKFLTSNKPVIMGSKTYLSLPKELPNRFNIVLGSEKYDIKNGCSVKNIEESLAIAEQNIKLLDQNNDEIFIIGGEKVYKSFINMNVIKRVYISTVNLAIEKPVDPKYFELSSWASKQKSIISLFREINPEFEFQIFETEND